MAARPLTLSAALLLVLAPVCGSAKATTYAASGTFANGATLGGTIGIDSPTGQVASTALTISGGISFSTSSDLNECPGVTLPCSVIEASTPGYLLRLFAATSDLTGGGSIPLYSVTNFPSLDVVSSLEAVQPLSFSDLETGMLSQIVGSTPPAIAEPPSLQALAAALLALAATVTPFRRKPR